MLTQICHFHLQSKLTCEVCMMLLQCLALSSLIDYYRKLEGGREAFLWPRLLFQWGN